MFIASPQTSRWGRAKRVRGRPSNVLFFKQISSATASAPSVRLHSTQGRHVQTRRKPDARAYDSTEASASAYHEVARVWMESWVSIRLEPASDKMLADLRTRIDKEMTDGWSLYVADDAIELPACWRSDYATATSISSSSILPITTAGSARCCCNSRASTA